jgi:hypothetical protein
MDGLFEWNGNYIPPLIVPINKPFSSLLAVLLLIPDAVDRYLPACPDFDYRMEIIQNIP